MTDDTFLERLRDEARQLQFEPDDVMTSRIAARVRARVSEESAGGVSLLLARWFRPVVASLAALSLAAILGVGWLELRPEPAAGLDAVSSSQTVDVSVGGDVFSVE
ncbi:MAG TPA: hypothetical protein VHX14_00295 [Thermoanaerobaculia bacterium]|jgi:uncharacterized membrane protein|nr:hypothetical protein [Thermoanaerobaculia bacterium]